MPAPAPHNDQARTYRHGDFDAVRLAPAKAGRSVSVCIPARNEASTIGPIVEGILSALTLEGGGVPLVDEVLVVDDGSTDGTGAIAERAGARVVGGDTASGGKGQAMRVALRESGGDLLAFVDGDVANFAPHFVVGLLGPLLTDDTTSVVKGFYQRPLNGAADGGGRVTELMARPVIDLLFPELAVIRQPLAGETAAPRWVFEKCTLADGYAVELALLIDAASNFGVETIAQVDLGVRFHRNRPLSELRPQATDILAAALARSPLVTGDGTGPDDSGPTS
ncbi:MAG TPA: glucosyl-3-phosphoglycerate synthase [Acidimicrobiales bacterium]